MEFKLDNLYTDSGCNFSLVQKANFSAIESYVHVTVAKTFSVSF